MTSEPLVTIGAFSVMTQLSRKSLHHYHEVDLLVPARVDERSGYRLYRVDQVDDARLIRQLRDLDMPIPEVREAVRAPADRRQAVIAAHLARMEAHLDETRRQIRALRDLLVPAGTTPRPTIRLDPGCNAPGIIEHVTLGQIDDWWDGALAELRAAIAASGQRPAGPPGGIYEVALFRDESGQATLYLPATGPVARAGRVLEIEIPPVRLAELTHEGPEEEIGQTYAALGIAVGQAGTGIDGPIRERYLGLPGADDPSPRRTVIGWPVSDDPDGYGVADDSPIPGG
ncbi:MAG TPA: MerR family transcriptional regulator [Thermomicrobiales bacterium]|jgi:DNA-binding transcriptional MerR regulator|nr:MerR family transcriptional regulator [Thermomicrobiales bacterium]